MEPVDIIATVIGVFTTVAAVLALQCKNMRNVIVLQLLSNALLFLQYSLQGTMSAGGVVILAILQTVVCSVLSSRGRPFPVWLTAAFIVGYTAVTVICYSSPFDILTCAAVWLFAIAVVQRSSAIYRILLVGNVILWLIYDVAMAPSAILTHAVILAFSIVGIVRLDRHLWAQAAERLLHRDKGK